MGMKITVIGAGTMGHGIAQVSAMAGHSTTLYDINEEALEHGLQAITQNLEKGVKRGKVQAEEKEQCLELLGTSSNLSEAVKGSGCVIEAVPENIDLKREIFTSVSNSTPDDCILATNTSSLSITEIAASSARPENVIGMHFFNPPHILKLLELVRAEQTSEETVRKAKYLGEKLGRELVLVQDSPGFASSRLGLVLGLEAIRMVQEGVASAEDIDRAMELGYRHPMGPLRLTDLVGLDVRLAIAEYLHKELGGEQFRPPQLLKKLVRAGKLGKKTGHGFYSW